MTPETRSSTHFFWNYLHDFDIGNPNIALSLRHSLEEAFMEDKAIIEAQQTVFDADPNYQLLAIGADAALTYFRWALALTNLSRSGTPPAPRELDARIRDAGAAARGGGRAVLRRSGARRHLVEKSGDAADPPVLQHRKVRALDRRCRRPRGRAPRRSAT